MKHKWMLLATATLLGLLSGCTAANNTAPTNQTTVSNTQNSPKTTVEANRPSNDSQNVTVSSGDKTLTVKQSNGNTEITDGKGQSVRANKGNSDEPDVYVIDESGKDSSSTVTDSKGNRVTTRTTPDGKQTSVVQSGNNKVEMNTENGKSGDSEITDGKGNKVKMKNGKIEIQSADGKKLEVKTPN